MKRRRKIKREMKMRIIIIIRIMRMLTSRMVSLSSIELKIFVINKRIFIYDGWFAIQVNHTNIFP